MGKQHRVLIAEDEAIIAEDLRLLLRDSGYEVVGVASSGNETIKKVAELSPDLVIMDVRLQGHLDGIETAKTIRARHNIPILYLTAFADETLVARARITEPCSIAFKPFLEEDLLRLVRELLFER